MPTKVITSKYAKPGINLRIREARETLGLSQRDLHEPGMSYAYISRIERDQRTPSLQMLLELADKLNTTALWLFCGRHKNCPMCKR